MKKPEKVILWVHISREKTEFVTHTGKPLYKYYVELPSWVGLAYRPYHAKVEIRTNTPSFVEREKETNKDEVQAYVKSNWSKKLTKMRKLNNNYMQVLTVAISDSHFLSHDDYENYHRELNELNKKYLKPSIDETKLRKEERP